MERRWGNRVVLDESVRVRRDNAVVGVAHLCELSLSGAFLRAPWRLPQLARVYVEIPCATSSSGSGRRSRTSLIEAFVVRHSPEGVGVEWCEFAPAHVVELMTERQKMLPPATAAQAAETNHRRRI